MTKNEIELLGALQLLRFEVNALREDMYGSFERDPDEDHRLREALNKVDEIINLLFSHPSFEFGWEKKYPPDTDFANITASAYKSAKIEFYVYWDHGNQKQIISEKLFHDLSSKNHFRALKMLTYKK